MSRNIPLLFLDSGYTMYTFWTIQKKSERLATLTLSPVSLDTYPQGIAFLTTSAKRKNYVACRIQGKWSELYNDGRVKVFMYRGGGWGRVSCIRIFKEHAESKAVGFNEVVLNGGNGFEERNVEVVMMFDLLPPQCCMAM